VSTLWFKVWFQYFDWPSTIGI